MTRLHERFRGAGTAAVVWRGICLGALLSACGGGSEHPANIGSQTGTGGGTGVGGGAGSRGVGGVVIYDGGGDTDGGAVGAPVVKVTSPTALNNPTAGTVLVADTVTATCTATRASTPGATNVDAASVKIAVLDAEGQVKTELPGTPTGNSNEYSAMFVVTMIDNGAISFRCRVSDTSTPPKTGSDQISTFIDHGPEVDVTTPAPDSAYPMTGAVPFAFKVTPAPLTAGDPNADVTSVTLAVNGVMIPLVRDPADAMGFKVAVDFNDTTYFPQPPAGYVPIEIRAKDSRKPAPGERVYSYRFALDGAGPVITLTKPKNQDIIGGKVTMEFTVVDALAGVDPKTVSVELNQVAKFYSPTDTNWTANKNNYTYTFDSANVSGSIVQVTVNITASDLAGNKTMGESVVLYLDNVPPTVDLDPPNVRQKRKMGTTIQCSESFDPLGEAASDNDRTSQPGTGALNLFPTFRALVWDETNFVPGQSVVYIAGTDQTSVYLYLQPDGANPDPKKALLIDTDGDPNHICDALNTMPEGVPLPNLRLNPVTPTGAAIFDSNDPAAAPDPATPDPQNPQMHECDLASDTNPTPQLCMGVSDLTQVIRHDAAQVEPVVYAIGGLMGLECTGTGWEIASQLTGAAPKKGWFCLAAIASDKVGNKAISPPLRICFDDGVGPPPACALSSEMGPSCTDGCTAPPGFGNKHFLATHQ